MPGMASAASSQKNACFRSSAPAVISLSKKRAKKARASASTCSRVLSQPHRFQKIPGDRLDVVLDRELREDVLERRQVHQFAQVRGRVVGHDLPGRRIITRVLIFSTVSSSCEL